jgi:hypothetical protein
MQQAEGDLVGPLDVVHGDQDGTERDKGAMRGLEQTNGLDRAYP